MVKLIYHWECVRYHDYIFHRLFYNIKYVLFKLVLFCFVTPADLVPKLLSYLGLWEAFTGVLTKGMCDLYYVISVGLVCHPGLSAWNFRQFDMNPNRFLVCKQHLLFLTTVCIYRLYYSQNKC